LSGAAEKCLDAIYRSVNPRTSVIFHMDIIKCKIMLPMELGGALKYCPRHRHIHPFPDAERLVMSDSNAEMNN
jgi:hypothetical protein